MSKNAKKTQPAPQKKNSSLIAMIVVLVVAVVLIVVLFARSNSLNSQLDTLNNELTETSNTLQQTITDKELKVLRKWLTKSFAINHTDRQAVKRLQMRLIRMGYMAEGSASMIYDAATADAVLRFQQQHNLPADGIPSKKTLMSIFEIHNAELSSD